jgi:hypothetical protein
LECAPAPHPGPLPALMECVARSALRGERGTRGEREMAPLYLGMVKSRATLRME